MDNYKSWSSLNKLLHENLCDELKNRITYFLTRYHKVHNSYGRASIRLDGREIVCFSWIEMYHQESAVSQVYKTEKLLSFDEIEDKLKPQWDENCTYCDYDFLNAVLTFRNMTVNDALDSDVFIIKTLAIMDKRIGKRTLDKIRASREYKNYPGWVRQFYELRLGGIGNEQR